MKKIIGMMALAVGCCAAAAEKEGAAPAKPDPAAEAKASMTDAQKAQADNLFGMFQEKLKHRFAPVIRNVAIGPARVGQPVSVTVRAGYETQSPIDRIVKAAVFYRLGTSGRLYGPVVLKSAGGDSYKGNIPPISKPGRLIVIPWVKDSYGNVGVDIPCAVSSWPPFEDPCMAPGAVDPDPVDDPAALIEDDYDIWEFQIGMDDKYIYFMTDVEGEISKGTLNPSHINAYLSMLTDTQELYGFEDISVLMGGGGGAGAEKFKGKEDKFSMIFYAPLATSFGMKSCFIPKFSEIGKAGKSAGDKDAAAGSAGDKPAESAAAQPEGNTAAQPGGEGAAAGQPGAQGGEKKEPMDLSKFMDTVHVKCDVDGSTLFTRLDKSVISQTMWKSLSVVGAINGFIDNPQMPLPKLREILPITKANYSPHVVEVK